MTLPMVARRNDPSPDGDDVREFLAGDERAFERLVDRYQRPLLRLCQRLLHRTDDALDLFQEVLMQVCRALPQLDDPGAFRTWMYRIAVRRARRVTERKRPGASDSLDEVPADVPADPLEHDEEVHALRSELAALPERQREVVVLRHYQTLTFAEIASVLDIREDAARASHYQALRKLRKTLASEEGS